MKKFFVRISSAGKPRGVHRHVVKTALDIIAKRSACFAPYKKNIIEALESYSQVHLGSQLEIHHKGRDHCFYC